MKISNEKPPVWDRIVEAFGTDWNSGVIVTYGDTVYTAKTGFSLDLHDHENVHVRQQAEMGVEKWWDKYLTDSKFRFLQEIEAYQAQVKYIKEHTINHKKAQAKIDWIRHSLMTLYGDMTTLEEIAKYI